MNYRIYTWRKPVKRIQVFPADLPSKYPSSLSPSFLLIWCWNILLATEKIGLALVTWVQRLIQVGQRIINVRSQRLALQTWTGRNGERVDGWLSRALTTVWHGLVTFGQSGLPMIRNRTYATDSRLNSQLVFSNQSSGDLPAGRFEIHSTERCALHLSSPREQDLRQELTEGHARFVGDLLAEEEELARVSMRVVRLQSLIRAQEQLLAEIASQGNPLETNQFPAETFDNLVGIGKSSSQGKVRNMPPLGGPRRISRNRARRNSG